MRNKRISVNWIDQGGPLGGGETWRWVLKFNYNLEKKVGVGIPNRKKEENKNSQDGNDHGAYGCDYAHGQRQEIRLVWAEILENFTAVSLKNRMDGENYVRYSDLLLCSIVEKHEAIQILVQGKL